MPSLTRNGKYICQHAVRKKSVRVLIDNLINFTKVFICIYKHSDPHRPYTKSFIEQN